MSKERIRRVKLHGKYYRQESHCNGGRDLPWLNVSGLWLERAGFNVGDAVEQSTLIIKNLHGDGDTRD